MDFDAKKAVDATVKWISDWFQVNGPGCNAIIGISGGKDSSITAALLVQALGKERVIGIMMPNGEQSDMDMALLLINHLGIESHIINIETAYNGAVKDIECAIGELSKDSLINLAPRLRMATLYAVGQSRNGRVANTCNLSEDWVGYSTRYGDAAGDFSPLSRLTVQEVKAVGRELGLPEALVDKVPIDGLSGLTDEQNLGFSYETLDKYLRTGVCEDAEIKALIDRKRKMNKFKLELMPAFEYDAPILADDESSR